MRSVALTEKLRNALQDNKSQSMDEGIFNEKDELATQARSTDLANNGRAGGAVGNSEVSRLLMRGSRVLSSYN